MADGGMPPPLEDMSATLEQAKKLRDLRLGSSGHSTSSANSSETRNRMSAKSSPGLPNSSSNGKQSGTDSLSTAAPAPNFTQTSASPHSGKSKTKNPKPTSNSNTGGGDFGGMKKGFLFGGAKPSSVSSSQKAKTDTQKVKSDGAKCDTDRQTDSIPFIKPQAQENDSGLKLDEVQQAMESTKGFLQDKDWVTEDLLEKVQKSETLSKRMGDPRFMQAVTEFQTNPQAAMAKYQGNQEMQQFLKEFCGILGEHFSSMGEKTDAQNPAPKAPSAPTGPKITEVTDEDISPSAQPQRPSVPVDPHVQQILSDPANQEILMDPKIQQLIQNLRTNPEKAQRMLREGDSTFKQKVDRLISLGLLKFQG